MSRKMLLELALLSVCLVKTGKCGSCEVLKGGRIGRCQGTFQENSLKELPANVRELELYNISMDTLPDGAFSHASALQKVVFSQVSLEHLQVSSSPFLPLKDSLESFEVYQSSNVFSWNFSALASMSKLQALIVEDSEMVELSEDFRAPSVQFIQLLNASISWIHPHAFEMNKNLTICSLARNSISRLKRSMFPSPAALLWSLDLSFNRLETLPKDLFTRMDSLHELKLDNNQITRIGPSILSPVWDNLSQLWLDGNKEVCWPFCSLVKNYTPMFMDSSKCRFRSKSQFILFDSFYPYCKGKQLNYPKEL